ncbi:glycosyltransferase family 4 protein [Candidatus Actinomarina]|jgi:glycosyltransferase involved in cell wall biosynthesis|nr:glycosyltransferase family 4 protein [Candidatus Actinomarina sp.]
MKKILVIHNKYREIGGEDIAVENELKLLKKLFIVEDVIFDNNIKNLVKQTKYFLLNNNTESNKLLSKKLKSFDPDLIYIHNTWFKVSLGVFKILKKTGKPIYLKLHNFRYNCTKSYITKKHLSGKSLCPACGLKKESTGIFNKYFAESYIKSFLIIRYGKQYFKILKDEGVNLFVLTDFHKKYLKNLGFNESKITVIPNYIHNDVEEIIEKKKDYIIYAGRISEEKGLQELISSFLAANIESLILYIIGSGPMLNFLQTKYTNNKKIRFFGPIENKQTLKLIKGSKAVVTATKLYEGQPTLLCEASSLKVPSIFPDSGGIKEFFPETTELMFKQDDYDGLQSKFQKILDSDLIQMEGQNNQIFIEKYLDYEKLSKLFYKSFDDE